MSQGSTEQGLILLQLVMQSIVQYDEDNLERYLGMINLERLSSEHLDSLFSRLITAAEQANNKPAIRVIINAFEPNYTDRYQLPLLNQILMDLRFEDEVVAFVLREYPDKSYLELASHFISYDDDPNIMTGLVRLEELRGPLSEDEYRELLNLATADDRYNRTAIHFFSYQLDTKSSYAPIPQWVRNFTGEETLPYDDEIVIPEPEPLILAPLANTEEIINLLTEGLRTAGRSQEDAELAQIDLHKRLAVTTPEQEMELTRTALENKARHNLANDEDIFAILGPVNTIYDDNLLESDSRLCSKYGGCRMLCCIEFEDFLNPDENIVYPISEYSPTEWFTGACQVCHRRIRRPAHALRMPLEHGGWKGCYDSEDCLRQDAEDNILINALIDTTLQQLNKIGIQDRLSREKEALSS